MLDKLDVINSMMAAAGFAPVTGPESKHPAYIKAEAKLNSTILDVLKLNLWFNTEDRDLMPGSNKEIVLPNNCINVDPVDARSEYIQRGLRLYNQSAGNFKFDGPVTATITVKLPFEEIPPSGQAYIRDKARYGFYVDEDGSEPKLSIYARDAQMAWVEFYREHLRCQDVNYFNGNNMAVQLARGTSRRRLPL